MKNKPKQTKSNASDSETTRALAHEAWLDAQLENIKEHYTKPELDDDYQAQFIGITCFVRDVLRSEERLLRELSGILLEHADADRQ